MKEYSNTLHIDAPPEKVFSILTDPEVGSGRFMKLKAVQETPDGVGSAFRYEFRALGMRLGGGTYTYSEYVPNQRLKMEFSGGPEMLLAGGPVATTWTFEPADGGTKVTSRPVFKTRIPVVNNLARRIMLWSWRTRDLPRFKAEIEKRAKAAVKA